MQLYQLTHTTAASSLLLPATFFTIAKTTLNNCLAGELPAKRKIAPIIKIYTCVFGLTFTFLLLISFLAPNFAIAENISYDGDSSLLKQDPIDPADFSLYSDIDIINNIITVNSGTIPGSVYGGVSTNGNMANNNTVIIYSGTINNNVYGGHSRISTIGANDDKGTQTAPSTAANANANNSSAVISANFNNVTFNGNRVYNSLLGGYAIIMAQAGTAIGGTATGDASANANANANSTITSVNNNKIAIGSGATITDYISGGYTAVNLQGGESKGGTANNTSSTIASANTNAFTAANANNAEVFANTNSVDIGDSASLSSNLFGGYAEIKIQGGSSGGGTSISQSTTFTANANGNALAYANDANVTANSNNITIRDGVSLIGSLYGGYAALYGLGGTAEGGNATASSSLYNATATAFTRANANNAVVSASGNIISLGLGITVSNVLGGNAVMSVQGGTATGGTASSSSTSTAATATATAYADAYVDNATVTAENNIVTLGAGTTVSGNLSGGYASIDVQGGTATGGTANSSSPTSANANAYATINAKNVKVSANNNNLFIEAGAVVKGNILGGHATLNAQRGTVTVGNAPITWTSTNIDASQASISANKNNISFNGRLGNGNIYGGYVLFEITTNNTVILTGSSATATDNIITIGVNAVLSATTSLYGGCLEYNIVDNYNPQDYGVFSGNTLNISSKHTLNGIYNFEYLGFTLPAGFSVGDSLITANTVNLNEYNTGITGTTVTDINSTGILTAGKTYTLIAASTGFNGSIANTEASGVYNTGFISGTYEWVDVGVTNNNLTATLKSMTAPSVNPGTGATGEGFAAGLIFLGQATDLRSRIYFVPQGPRFMPFAKMVYGKQYITTGSSVSVKGFSALAGLALNTNFENGDQLVVGAFLESGWGDYNSRASFINSVRIKSNGNTEYYGGGVLARYARAGGLYGEGTCAIGKTETDYKSRDFTSSSVAKYDYSVPYYSAHVALGQVLRVTDILDLDVYTKYLWTRQGGDSVTVLNQRLKFKAADSHRLQVGGKLKANVLPQLQPYAGATYEYEFSGKIKGSLYGMNLDKPSLRGGTGIGELGLVWTPSDAQNLKVDLGVQGYVGKREGVTGSLTVSLSF